MQITIYILSILSILIGLLGLIIYKRRTILNIITLLIASTIAVVFALLLFYLKTAYKGPDLPSLTVLVFTTVVAVTMVSALIRGAERNTTPSRSHSAILILMGISAIAILKPSIIALIPAVLTVSFTINTTTPEAKLTRYANWLIIASIVLLLPFLFSWLDLSSLPLISTLSALSTLALIIFISIPFIISNKSIKPDGAYKGVNAELIPAYFFTLLLFTIFLPFKTHTGLWILVIGLIALEAHIITRKDTPLILGIASAGVLTAIIGVWLKSSISTIGALLILFSDMLILPPTLMVLSLIIPQEIKGPLARTTLWINHPRLSGVVRYGIISLIGLPPAISFIGRLMIISTIFACANIILALIFTLSMLIHISPALNFMRNILANPPPEEYPTITRKERVSYIIPMIFSYLPIALIPFFARRITELLR